MPKSTGPFGLIERAEYDVTHKAANSTNNTIRKEITSSISKGGLIFADEDSYVSHR